MSSKPFTALSSQEEDLTGARPQVGLSSLPQRSRKRQRNDSPRAMHNAGVDPDRPLWKFLQALHIRIKNLEEVVEECIRKTHIASESPQKTASILDSCVARLEQKLSLVYNYNESPTGSEREYCYPADSCNRSYSRMDLFDGHIRGSPGLGHKSLKSIIDETRCLQCNFPYRSPHELVSHEMIDHKDGYMSRIQAFVQHFRSTSTSTCETSSNVGDEGHLAQNNDGHQPLSSNVRLIDEQPSLTSSLVNPPQAISIATGRGHQYAERIVDAGTLETANELCAENTIRGLAPLPKKRQSQLGLRMMSLLAVTKFEVAASLTQRF